MEGKQRKKQKSEQAKQEVKERRFETQPRYSVVGSRQLGSTVQSVLSCGRGLGGLAGTCNATLSSPNLHRGRVSRIEKQTRHNQRHHQQEHHRQALGIGEHHARLRAHGDRHAHIRREHRREDRSDHGLRVQHIDRVRSLPHGHGARSCGHSRGRNLDPRSVALRDSHDHMPPRSAPPRSAPPRSS
ncbi:hypothetical protein BGZ61DRAFT_150511 [Ilyonectria robusta]|uniref:uncharacterized protein n=1 Tax=Ilyonectria robusta TaxID=1079257 RepID=UPI001E8E139E|nr:uncharacterized protein BGZ61DRAFT_150511 [Ilyonectria robusta]KAH8661328.1 hypothetical protein BGZ61DRAFT_150511 [Ilyonectria robusta]